MGLGPDRLVVDLGQHLRSGQRETLGAPKFLKGNHGHRLTFPVT